MTATTGGFADTRFDPGSFRDRSSRVIIHDGEVLRGLSATAAQEWEFVQSLRFFRDGMARGRIVQTRDCPHRANGVDGDSMSRWAGMLRHELLPFISYPYEWSFSMLRDAALLQLQLLSSALEEGGVLKDATPYNTQFRGAQCLFIDIPSFVRYRQGQPWTGYRQFCEMFLYPLMLQSFRSVDFQPLLRGNLAGITPRQFLNLMSLRDLFRPGVFTHVYLHAKLEEWFGDRAEKIPQSMRQSGFQRSLIEQNVRRLTRLVSNLKWRPKGSLWADYDTAPSPAQVDGAEKEEFVRRVVQRRRWRQAWDLGCNVGRYSRIASENADFVVAMDVDHLAVDRLYLSLKEEGNTKILPLACNLADPSPGLGWRGRERRALSYRGNPDLVLCLALIHHLVMRENILLPELMDWLASLGSALVIEFVDKADPQVQSLLANREDQYDDYSPEVFERLLSARFEVRAQRQLPSGTRTIYFAQPRLSP